MEKKETVIRLDEQEAVSDPLVQFSNWYEEELRLKGNHPEAMTLATATSQGIPSARIVLLKGFDPQGFLFFTNYLSRKGREIKVKGPKGELSFTVP
ncbi:MAG: pyridoxamine 5'-phosphate oxidase family protein, partial [bacterium]